MCGKNRTARGPPRRPSATIYFVSDTSGQLQRPEPHRPDPAGTLVERRTQAELTPAQRAQLKRNRRLLLSIAIPAVFLGIGALVAAILADSGTPRPHPLFVPAGYHAVGDGVFSYAVPNSWSKNDAYSDDAGDLETSGQTGFVGDHLTARATAPLPGEAAPQVFQSFGQGQPTAFAVSAPTETRVAGATTAYRYTISRPGGFSATAIDAWESSNGAELWLLVDASPQVTDQLVATLKG